MRRTKVYYIGVLLVFGFCCALLAGQDGCEPCTDRDGDGYAREGGICGPVDCDDLEPDINPGIDEAGFCLCDDGIDQDCDGVDCQLPEIYTIYQIQNPDDPCHPAPDSEVTIVGVIVTEVTSQGGFFVEEPEGGPWSGIFVYDPSGAAPSDLFPGDELTITGVPAEYYDMTEIGATEIMRTGTCEPIPAPSVVDSCDVAAPGPLAESYESVLIQVLGPVVTDIIIMCGQFEVDHCLWIDCEVPGIELGDTFDSIAGILIYSYGGFKINPGDCSDFDPPVCG